MFDVTDPRQKAAYDILKNAGYGKRTPIVVDALLDSLKTVAPMPAAMPTQSGISVGLTEMDVRRIIQETMESVLDSHNLTVATPPQPVQPVQAPSTVETIQYPAPPAQGKTSSFRLLPHIDKRNLLRQLLTRQKYRQRRTTNK